MESSFSWIADGVVENFCVSREGYCNVLDQFYEKLKLDRKRKIEETGNRTYTEFEALMPVLVKFLRPEEKCRIVLEYDPAEEKVSAHWERNE